MDNKNRIVVGISGVTCGGKSTLAKALEKRYKGSIILCQDDYFLPIDSKEHTLIPELNHYNWDIPTAFDMDTMRSRLDTILNTKCIDDTPLVVIEGLLIFTDKTLSRLCDKKYFLTLPYEICLARRTLREYNPPDVPGYFDKCVWPEYIKNKELALDMNPDMQIFDGVASNDSTFNIVLKDVDRLVAEFKRNHM